jgi:hypothetical protein
MSSRGFRRRNNRRRGRQQADRPSPPAEPIVYPDCPVCSKPVRDLPAALSHRATGLPAHFDCILKELKDSNEVLPQEKICYLGAGTFGILQFRAQGAVKFTIRKKIPYEEKDSPHEWKKPLLVSC